MPSASHSTGSLVFSKISPAKPTLVYDTYWKFAVERQNIFFKRLSQKSHPWTDDQILKKYKFTNAYRASDRVSQFLIRNVIYKGKSSREEVFFRTILFKFFNRIDTWEMLEKELGEVSYSDFSVKRYETILNKVFRSGKTIYSAAYIMPSAGRRFPSKFKHGTHLRLLAKMMEDSLPQRISACKNMRHAFEMLCSYPSIGPFLGYQYLIDLNYSEIINFSEMEFVIPGPGAKDGIKKCFRDLGGLTEAEIIRVVTDRQEREFERLGLKFKSLWGRPLNLVDCQNLFCEVDKYARLAHPDIKGLTGRTRIKQKFQASADPIALWYPPKWGINDSLQCEETDSKNNARKL